ncbi:MAG: hypothetical protein FWH04_09630 [Oscillospiraceae bacterium]|nr:hypothetical protein [Oscillospiraceae bacterium]
MYQNVGSAGNAHGVAPGTDYSSPFNSTKSAPKGKAAAPELNPSDTYVPETKNPESTNSKIKAYDPSTVKKLWNETQNATAHLRKIVEELIAGKIGEGKHSFQIKGGQTYWAMKAASIEVDDDTRLEAERMIGEDGYYGVKQTTARIVDFAKALYGPNVGADSIEEARAAIQWAFDDVAKMFGGFDKLPEVTQQTYKAVMQAIDEWLAEASPAEQSVAEQ